jgi:hypothetical protein
MRLEPHENLSVWSIRHDLYGPGRYHPHLRRYHHGIHHHEHPHHHHGLHARVHRHDHCDRWEPCEVVRVVERPIRPEPADCRPCHCGGETLSMPYPPDKTYPAAGPPPEMDLVTVPADIAPPSEPGALQGYFRGQPVPASGNLLDVFA